ncbi:DUF2130 domain-containing protein [Candidatus Saccharibacteria bacterium]|nr:DUF2130 domain-containing protein [Candidatus Saccharibacteria bacterium]
MTNEIICPHCKKAFKIDQAGYADIVRQVRNHQFEEELAKHLDTAKREKEDAIKLAEQAVRIQLEADLARKESELVELKMQDQALISNVRAEKDAEITKLLAKLQTIEVEKKLELTEALAILEKQRDKLSSELIAKDHEKQLLASTLSQKYQAELKTKDDIIRLKDEEIELRKDMKARLSTKMLGETLEQHCEMEFEKLRATGFQNASFGKDNDASEGSKGDYIYREFDQDGNEVISIMFEMKNEADQTATKKKNDDFLTKLDQNRIKKGCEYAVLVSLLEPDSELYNTGIIDVSHLFPKMYVIRPQFFIPIITLLRNAAQRTMGYKAELAQVRAQNIDISNFEENLEIAKQAFARNYDLGKRKFQTAIEGIDKTIRQLEKTKEALLSSENNYRLANNKLQDTTIKRLTRGNPTMEEQFTRARE